MTRDRTTLEEKLRNGSAADKRRAGDKHDCPNCGRPCHAFEIVDVADVPGISTDMACTRCLIDADRDDRQIQERKARKALPPWESPEGLELKAHRDRTLDRLRWTVARDSPLTAQCQTAWLAYLRAWHRMTVDASSPAEFKEPAEPAMEYAPDPAPQAKEKRP